MDLRSYQQALVINKKRTIPYDIIRDSSFFICFSILEKFQETK